MSFEEFIEAIEDAIYPFELNDSGKYSAANLLHKYPTALLKECIEVGTRQYLCYDGNGKPTKESVEVFLDKLGGIAYNKSRAPIKQEIQHIISLEKIVKNAAQNSALLLSANAKKDMNLFRDLGNYSAHKIWYNCTQQDIQPHTLKYRALIEELIYKAGLRK